MKIMIIIKKRISIQDPGFSKCWEAFFFPFSTDFLSIHLPPLVMHWDPKPIRFPWIVTKQGPSSRLRRKLEVLAHTGESHGCCSRGCFTKNRWRLFTLKEEQRRELFHFNVFHFYSPASLTRASEIVKADFSQAPVKF